MQAINHTLWIKFEDWTFFQRNYWITKALPEQQSNENTENYNFELPSREEEHINRTILDESKDKA